MILIILTGCDVWNFVRLRFISFYARYFHQLYVTKHFLALVHDLSECIVGDITPYCGVSREEKRKREDAAMVKISELTGLAGNYLMELYNVMY